MADRARWWWGVVCLAAAIPARAGSGYTMRLEVGTARDRVRLDADRYTLLDGDVRDVLVEEARGEMIVRTGPGGLRVPGTRVRPRSVIVRAAGPLRVEGRSLAGELELLRDEHGTILAVNHLDLERYLQGILVAEMSPSWPLEALRAQAVAARTYAVHRRLQRESHAYDLSSTTLDQVYAGIERETERTRRAVESTRGQVLTWGGIPAEALFHACCAGRTLAAGEVFGNRVPYLVGVDDPDCAGCPHQRWEATVGLGELEAALGSGWKGRLRTVRAGTDARGNNTVVVLSAGGEQRVLSRPQLRRLLGTTRLWSSRFDWEQRGDRLVFTGRGAGHGVGMCQWGARGMALRGEDYRSILARYYPGCSIRKMY